MVKMRQAARCGRLVGGSVRGKSVSRSIPPLRHRNHATPVSRPPSQRIYCRHRWLRRRSDRKVVWYHNIFHRQRFLRGAHDHQPNPPNKYPLPIPFHLTGPLAPGCGSNCGCEWFVLTCAARTLSYMSTAGCASSAGHGEERKGGVKECILKQNKPNSAQLVDVELSQIWISKYDKLITPTPARGRHSSASTAHPSTCLAGSAPDFRVDDPGPHRAPDWPR